MMQKVRCYECGRGYDYDEDGFCPKCGAFNQPPRSARVSADGTVVRVDGLNERDHKGSFVHEELHAEDRQRRKYGLDKSVQRIQKVAKPSAAADQKRGKEKGAESALVAFIIWLFFLFFVISNF